MNEIYKVCELNNDDTINKFIVFFGNSDIDLNKLFSEDPNNSIFKEIFSKSQIDNIVTKNIPIIFSNQTIYLDDSIQILKQKIIKEYSNEIAFEEIYLFAKQIQETNNDTIFEDLTQNGTLSLTQNILNQFISNINDFNISTLIEKESYDFNDIIDLNIPNKILVNIPLGQHIVTGKDIFAYSVNPN